jgi:type I restriction enzyme S subunit
MELRQGYKNTEVGIIPEDWSVLEFKDVIDGFSSGQTPYRGRPEFYKGDIPWITSGELNYNVITDTIEKITIEGARDANLKMIPKGTFLFAITGLEAAGTRGSCAITGIEATTNQSCMALYPKKGLLITPYLFHYYVRYGDELAFKYCQGTKQQSYTGRIAKKLPIIVPPTIEEQISIATAINDTDSLIDNLEKLIAKKRNIKQGAMQKLLQSKKGWEVKKLGEIAEMFSGGTPLTSISNYYNGNIPWVVIADITKAGKYISETEKTISNDGVANSSAKLFKKGILLFAMYASIGKTTIALMDTTCNQAILGIQPKLIATEYLYYFLSFNERKFATMGQTGTQSNLSKDMVQKIEIPLPPTLEEQTHIATILSDMDAEIAALETKLVKYRNIKLGMMQNLLTGKIRLV